MRRVLLLLLPLIIAFCSAWGPRIIKGPCPIGPTGGFNGDPVSLPGVANYWVYTNGVIVDDHTPGRITNWAGRVGDAIFTNGPSTFTHWPTNTTKGIYFEGFAAGQGLRSTKNLQFANSHSIALVLESKRISYASVPIWYGYLFGSQSGLTSPSADSNLVVQVFYNGGAGSESFVGGFLGNTLHDLVITLSNSVSGGGVAVYLDGVLTTNRLSANFTDFNTGWSAIGSSGAAYYEGWIRDLGIYTNILDASSISNFHYYRTNLYGGSP